MQKRSNSGKQLGLMDALAISTGSTIAAGVFILGAIAINYAGESILASIAIAAVLAILSGICLSQLSAVVSKDGSLYEYTRPFSPLLGFTVGILRIGSLLAFAAAVGIRSVTYLNAIFFSGMTLLESTSLSVALIILGALLVMSSFRFSVKLMLFLVGLGVFAVLVALMFGANNVNMSMLNLNFDGSDYSNVLFSAGLLFFALSGFTMISRSRSKLVNTDKTAKKATLLSIILLAILFTILATVMMALLMQTGVGNVGPLLEKSYLGSTWLITFMSAVRLVSLFGAIAVCFLVASSTMKSMSENKDLLYSLKRLNHNGRPADSIVMCLFITLVLALLLASSLLLYFAAAAMLLAFVIVDFSALEVSLKRRRDAKVKASLIGNKLFPVIPILGIVGNLAVMFCLGTAPLVAALILVLLSLFHFKYIRSHLPRKAVARNRIYVARSGGDFSKE